MKKRNNQQKLKSDGSTVTAGIEKECKLLNKMFLSTTDEFMKAKYLVYTKT